MNIERWKVDSSFFDDEDYKLNNRIALENSQNGFNELTKTTSLLTIAEIENFLNISPDIYKTFKGNGIDIGGGDAAVSSIIAKSELVSNIICLEISENTVEKWHPQIIKFILGNDSDKVRSVIGDFDNLELKDSTLDFAISWDSIHHSNNPIKTLRESGRVLKPGGYFVLVDRAHNNSTSEKEIQRMLNVQYSKEFLLENYLPEDTILTRSDNGEHEYRYKEWERFFLESKFKIEKGFMVREKHEKNSFSNDASLDEVFVDYEVGGFERQKVVYLLKNIK